MMEEFLVHEKIIYQNVFVKRYSYEYGEKLAIFNFNLAILSPLLKVSNDKIKADKFKC